MRETFYLPSVKATGPMSNHQGERYFFLPFLSFLSLFLVFFSPLSLFLVFLPSAAFLAFLAFLSPLTGELLLTVGSGVAVTSSAIGCGAASATTTFGAGRRRGRGVTGAELTGAAGVRFLGAALAGGDAAGLDVLAAAAAPEARVVVLGFAAGAAGLGWLLAERLGSGGMTPFSLFDRRSLEARIRHILDDRTILRI